VTYRFGMDARTAALLRMEPGEPRVICDGEGCGLARPVNRTRGLPPAWFVKHKAPPGWSLQRTELPDGSITRVDLCPRCKLLPKEST
jgi:hypothetical protein